MLVYVIFRSVLVVVAAHCECSTPTGLARTRPTSSTRSSSPTRLTRPSAATRRSTGSWTPWWSIVSCAVSPRLASDRVVSARDTASPRLLAARDAPTGRRDRLSNCTESDRECAFCFVEKICLQNCVFVCMVFRLIKKFAFHQINIQF